MTSFPYVQARYDAYGNRPAPALAFVIHMAEGGNTVAYLAHNPARGVSVHFVVQYSGRIVQMLRLGRISGSINPGALRMTDDPPFYGYNHERIVYGVHARVAVLGVWSHNPNAACITVEVEGFARNGPNLAQRLALVRLYRYLVTELPTIRGVLGHRDFQNYKACPGKLVNYAGMSLATNAGKHGLQSAAERARINAST